MTDLIANLHRIFGSSEFDVTDVLCKAHGDPELTKAIDAEVPRSRYKSGYYRGRLRHMAIRMWLSRSKDIRRYRHGLFRVRSTVRNEADANS